MICVILLCCRCYVSTFYVIFILPFSRCKDTTFLSFNHFCCFYSINHHCVILDMKDIHPTFVVRHHMPRLRMYASDIGIAAYTIEVGKDGKRKYLLPHCLFVSPCTFLGHVLRQEIGQLAKVSSGRCVNLNSVGSHVSSDTWTTIHRNTRQPTSVRVFRRLDNPRAQLLYAHIRPLAQMLSALAVHLFYMVLLPWYYLTI